MPTAKPTQTHEIVILCATYQHAKYEFGDSLDSLRSKEDFRFDRTHLEYWYTDEFHTIHTRYVTPDQRKSLIGSVVHEFHPIDPSYDDKYMEMWSDLRFKVSVHAKPGKNGEENTDVNKQNAIEI